MQVTLALIVVMLNHCWTWLNMFNFQLGSLTKIYALYSEAPAKQFVSVLMQGYKHSWGYRVNVNKQL